MFFFLLSSENVKFSSSSLHDDDGTQQVNHDDNNNNDYCIFPYRMDSFVNKTKQFFLFFTIGWQFLFISIFLNFENFFSLHCLCVRLVLFGSLADDIGHLKTEIIIIIIFRKKNA